MDETGDSNPIQNVNDDVEESISSNSDDIGQVELATEDINSEADVEIVTAEVVVPQEIVNVEEDGTPGPQVTIDIDTPSPPKKRKRESKGTPEVNSLQREDSDDDDDFRCPICLDAWEMTGEHRLVSLRCGHLFGEACIRRWLKECANLPDSKICPKCKTKATLKDIRRLYGKRLRAIDRSEEYDLRKALEVERTKYQALEMELNTLKVTYALSVRRVQDQDLEIERLKGSLRSRPGGCDYGLNNLPPLRPYKLYMEHNINISKDPGCRVMIFTARHSCLLVSQKSVVSLFPGYGLRTIDVSTFQPTNFMNLTNKVIRDISATVDREMVACASMEPVVKLYDLRRDNKVASTVSANNEKNLWACSWGDVQQELYIYAGSQQGSTYVFDTRSPNTVVTEYETPGDLSPVISIAIIPKCQEFPMGGFCICKLQSVWFFEYNIGLVTKTKLNVEGPFMSMNYETSQKLLVITARISQRFPEARFIIGKLCKVESQTHLEVHATLLGSKITPVMTRNCQIAVESNSLLATYVQDAKQLAIFDLRRQKRLQSLPVNDVIYDTCPIYTSQGTYVGALTETKCRVYRLNEM